jgi:hypothetical protein
MMLIQLLRLHRLTHSETNYIIFFFSKKKIYGQVFISYIDGGENEENEAERDESIRQHQPTRSNKDNYI